MPESKLIKQDKVIYMLKNKINGKMYIGKTCNLNRRLSEHKSRNKLAIQKAINKYGIENFKKIILEDGLTSENVYEREKYWINYYDTYRGEGYNSCPGGIGMPSGKDCPMFGTKNPKHSERMKGEGNPMYGKKRPDARERLLKDNPIYKVDTSGKNHWAYGKTFSKETRNKMSKSQKGKRKGEKNPMYGVTGEDHPRNKLNKEQGQEIYYRYHNEDNQTLTSLSKEYPVGKSTIGKIVNCNHWTTEDLR